MTKISVTDMEKIRQSDKEVGELAEKYSIGRGVIYAIRNNTYRNHSVKIFGSNRKIKNIIIEEYIHIFKEEPEKITVMKLTELYQFIIWPKRIIMQVDNKMMADEGDFREAIHFNLKSYK